MKKLVLIYAAFLFGCSHHSEYKPLQLKSMTKLDGYHEVSGATFLASEQKQLIVTDNSTDHYIYELNGRQLNPWLDLETLNSDGKKTFAQYEKESIGRTGQNIDLEGIAVCEYPDSKVIFLANERLRDVIKIDWKGDQKSFSTLSTPIREYFKNDKNWAPIETTLKIEKKFLGTDGKIFTFKRDYHNQVLLGVGNSFDNAGFEGIAADCENKKLFIARERQPRFIIKTDFDGKVLELFLIPESKRQFSVGKDPFGGKGDFVMEPDVSDLTFFDHHLYVLERNTGEIAQLDPNTGTLIARYDYENWEHIYTEVLPKTQLPTPFGMAESLWIEKVGDQKLFHISFDTNVDPSKDVSKQRTHLNEKGYKLFGCETYADKENCLEKNAMNPIFLTLEAK